MTSITDFMQHNHRHCDEFYADAEAAASEQNWDKATSSWQQFRDEFYRHIDDKEEGVLFPAIEAVNGPMGPTMMMRGEHDQMRALIAQMDAALGARDGSRFLGLGEQLMVTIAQHNMKEEQILYPMMDRFIPNAAELIAQMS